MKIKKDENIQHNTKEWFHNAFSGPKLEKKKKNGEQLKHRNIMNDILWIYDKMLVGVLVYTAAKTFTT